MLILCSFRPNRGQNACIFLPSKFGIGFQSHEPGIADDAENRRPRYDDAENQKPAADNIVCFNPESDADLCRWMGSSCAFPFLKT